LIIYFASGDLHMNESPLPAEKWPAPLVFISLINLNGDSES
jgi:hypothetical protein